MKKSSNYLILIVIVLIAILMRLTPVLFEREVWYDEAFTGILIKENLSSMNDMIDRDVHPPLHYWLLKPWTVIFDQSPVGMRSFSFLMGILTVISIFLIGKWMFCKDTAIIAAAITTISPFAIEYSQEARMYSLFGLLFLWATWFFYQAMKKNKKKHWVLWGIFGGLCFYTHYLSLFFFIVFYAVYVAYQRYLERRSWKSSFLGNKKIGFWIGTGTIFIFFLTWIKIFIAHISKGNLGWIDPSHLSDLPKTLQIFFFGHPPGTGGVPWSNEFKFFFDGSSAGLLIFVLIIILFVYAWMKKMNRGRLLVLSGLSFGTLLFLIVLSHNYLRMMGIETEGDMAIKLYVARYFMPAALLIYLLFAGLITTIFSKKWFIASFAIYGCMLLTIVPPTYSTGWTKVAEAGETVLENRLIITENPFEYTIARYYFGEDRVRFFNKGNPTEDFEGWVVVGNKNRITDINEVKKMDNAIIVAKDCDWDWLGLNTVEKVKLDQLSVCEIVQEDGELNIEVRR